MALVDTFAVRLAEMRMQKLGATLVAAETNLVVHIPFKQVRSEALFDRLVNRVWK